MCAGPCPCGVLNVPQSKTTVDNLMVPVPTFSDERKRDALKIWGEGITWYRPPDPQRRKASTCGCLWEHHEAQRSDFLEASEMLGPVMRNGIDLQFVGLQCTYLWRHGVEQGVGPLRHNT